MIYPTLWRGTTPLWEDMFSVRRDFDRLLDRFAGQGSGEMLAAWAPVVDVQETADDITVHAELPGINPEDVNVTVQNGVLSITGEKREEREEGKASTSFHMLERRYGRFERSFALPRSVEADKVKAQFQNGVLTVRLPKSEEAKPRRIQIEGSNGEPRKQQVSSGETKKVEVGTGRNR